MLNSLRSALYSTRVQAEAYGYGDAVQKLDYDAGSLDKLLENTRAFQEAFKTYTRVESLVKAIEDGRVQLTEREVRAAVEEIATLTGIYKGVISSNYKIIQALQRAACPDRVDVDPARRARFSREVCALLSLSPALDTLGDIIGRLLARDPTLAPSLTDAAMLGIFDEALSLFSRLDEGLGRLGKAAEQVLVGCP